MPRLFKDKILKGKLESFEVPNFEEKLEIVKGWHKAYEEKSLHNKTESQCEQAFNSDFFVKVLDYTEYPKDTYTIEPKATTDSSTQTPDAILAYHENGKRLNVSAVVEIKDVNKNLEKPQQRVQNDSPIQQAFKYKPQFKECSFVIATNFYEIRLFKDNQLDYESFTLDDLTNPENNYFNFRKFYFLLCAKNFITKGGKSNTEQILSDIRIDEEKITKKFYADYKKFRQDLIKDIIKQNKPKKNEMPTVIEKAQKIIDRIVFVCFCEDMGLLPEHTLQMVLKLDKTSFGSTWDTLKGFFHAIDKGSEKLDIPNGYNGGLFAKDEVLEKLEVSDEICKKFIELGNYDFSEDLSVNILGHIFEQSISDLEELKNIYEEEKPVNSKRKKDGIFYTPDYIVDYIVRNSLGKYLEEKEKEIKEKHGLKEEIKDKNYEKRAIKVYEEYQDFLQNVKVLDPACGSGAFLVNVFDFLLAENKRVANMLSELKGGTQGIFDTESNLKSILQNNIYGVDLNPESVEITKLSLWLKTAQQGKKLADLNENIKCGNSLIDDPEVAGERAFKWEVEFKEIMESGGFDVVVGNPPYGAAISKSEQNYFIEKYKTAFYKIDSYGLFIEKGLNCLSKEGFLGFIIPYTCLTIQQHKKLRELMMEGNMDKIINLPTKIFEDADLDTIVLILNNSRIKKKKISIGRIIQQQIRLYNEISVKNIKANKDLIININLSEKDSIIIDKIKKCSESLSDKFEVSQGLIPYDKYKGHTPKQIKNRVWHSEFKKDDSYKPELQGKEIGRYKIEWQGKTWISYGDWLAAPRESKFFTMPRILIMEITRGNYYKLSAIFTDKEYYNTPSIINIISTKGSNVDLLFLLTLINSRLFSWYHTKANSKANAITSIPKILVGDVRKLPIPKVSKEEQKPFIEKADKMLTLNKDFHEKLQSALKLITAHYSIEKPSKKLQKFYELDFNEFKKQLKLKELSLEKEKELLDFFDKETTTLNSLKAEIETTDREIDEMVFDLYDLTQEERQIISNS